MKAKYQKYYDALKGANLSGGVSKISSAVNTAKTGLSSMQTSLSASSWSELGAMTVNSVTIPSLIQDLDLLNTNVTGALTEVATKCTELVSQLTELEALEKELETLGSTWTYTEGGSHTQSEVNSHNSKITETTTKRDDKEKSIDGIIDAINGITLATATSTTTTTGTESTGTDLTATPTDTTSGSTQLTSANGSKMSIPSDPTVAAKKLQFIGDVDDPNNYAAVNPNYRSMRKTMQLFDNTTGEILNDHDIITIKKGETRVITVKLPTDTGMINEIHRTTADGSGAFRSGKIVKAKSDIDPDPNNIEYVNFREWSNHYPADKSLMHNNSYDWIITAVGDGKVQCSQTCQYTTSASKGENLKAMINLVVKVEDS